MYGVYFIEPNQSIVSDFEGYFLLNSNRVKFCGSSGIFSEAYQVIQKDPSINVIIIAQELTDMNCIKALQQLSGHSALKIVCINKGDELLQKQINDYGAKVLIKPYNFTDLNNVIFAHNPVPQPRQETINSSPQQPQPQPQNQPQPQSAPQQQPSQNIFNPAYNSNSFQNSQGYQNQGPQQSQYQPQNPFDTGINDNPFANINSVNKSSNDIKEQLRQVRREKPNSVKNNSFLQQQVIAIHNQKGGVGKTTLAKELAIAMRRMNIVKNGQSYQPKVCLCDFDLGASDIISVLNLPSKPNISTFYNDLHMEAKRIGAVKGQEEPIENIRFNPQQILNNYLILHESGIYVLAAPENKRDSIDIHSEDISAIIDNLKACGFDYIILDTGPNILGYTLMALLKADTVLAVTTCEITSVSRLNSIIQEIVNVSGFNPNKLKLVVNMYDGTSDITPEEIVELLHIELVGTIPKYNEIGNINNEGYSAFYNKVSRDKKANMVYAETINRLAKRITNLDRRGTPSSNKGETNKKRSFWKSLFGGN